MSVRLITDSTTDLFPEAEGRVEVLPISVRFGDQEYLDKVDITSQQFYEKLVSSDTMPTTSQVPPAVFAQAFQEAVEAGDSVVCLTISTELSGTCQSALMAASQFPGKVFVVDSRTVIMGTGILVQYALNLIDQGKSAQAVAQALEDIRDRVKIVAVADTLEYLKRGGRISKAVAFAGGLLNIKPILAVDNGVVGLKEKARGTKQINAMLAKAVESFGGIDCSLPIMFGYSGLDDSLLNQFQQEDSFLWEGYQGDLHRVVVGAAVGTHVGPGAAAMAFFANNQG